MSVQVAKAVPVPIQADRVDSPEVRYGYPLTAIFIPIERVVSDVSLGWGRVTFEELDSIRCCRGEQLPYDWDDDTSDDLTSWIFDVIGSAWLKERHDYEMRYYKYPLLDEFRHYVFAFHDEFVEAIAKGIWVESVGPQLTDEILLDHPLMELPRSLPCEEFLVDRICCEVRRNPRPIPELVEASKQCSQKLFQFRMKFDGESGPLYSAHLRTLDGNSTTRLRAGGFFPDLVTISGVAQVEDMVPAWRHHVRDVMQRARRM